MRFVRRFEECSKGDAAAVSARVANLGELIRGLGVHGARVPGGFVVTADGYRDFLRAAHLEAPIRELLAGIVREDHADLVLRAARLRELIEAAPLPADLEAEVRQAYQDLSGRYALKGADVAVVGASCGDGRPESAANPLGTQLNVRGEDAVVAAVRKSFAGAFTACALDHRDGGCDPLEAAPSVSVQKMVRADLAASGVVHSRDPESGHDGVIVVTAGWGLSAGVLEGKVAADRFFVHKATFKAGFKSLIRKQLAKKEGRLVYAPAGSAAVTELEEVRREQRFKAALSDADALQLASWSLALEEAAKQAGEPAPDLEWSKCGLTGELFLLGVRPAADRDEQVIDLAAARTKTQLLLNVGNPEHALKAALQPNDGVGLASMDELYASWVRVHPMALIRYPDLPHELLLEVDRATRGYPDKGEYLVDKLSQGIGTIAAAFFPKPVVLRLSEFHAAPESPLIGGKHFQPTEEKPMAGWRGATRYFHPDFKQAFLLEVAAIKRARDDFGLKNLKIAVPYCRTPDEGRKVFDVLREGGLKPGEDGLEIVAIAELPSNVLLADEFAQVFDGLSIGSSDLTQLVLGPDRDASSTDAPLDEASPAVRDACARIIDAAHRFGKKAGIFGHAGSEFPDFTAFLIDRGIDSISLNPDAVASTVGQVLAAEAAPPKRRATDDSQVIRIDRRRGQDRRQLEEKAEAKKAAAKEVAQAEAQVALAHLGSAAVAVAPKSPMALHGGGFFDDEEPVATD